MDEEENKAPGLVRLGSPDLCLQSCSDALAMWLLSAALSWVQLWFHPTQPVSEGQLGAVPASALAVAAGMSCDSREEQGEDVYIDCNV